MAQLQLNINWQQIEKIPLKTKVLGLIIILFLIGGLFFYFLYLPLTKELVQVEAKLAQEDKVYREKKAIADNLETFKEEVRRLNERLDLALQKLPNNTEIDKILIDVPNLAKEEEMQVTAFKPGKETTQDFYASIPFTLELTGTYSHIAKFIEKVARLPRIIKISDISLKPARTEKGAGQTMLTATMSAVTYRFAQQTATPAGKDNKKGGR